MSKVQHVQHGYTRVGSAHSREYKAWTAMRQRCNNERDAVYPWYGGRGIRVCARWNDFANFLADLGPRPPGRMSLDRIDNDGNYEPDNCRWTGQREQARNRTANVVLTVDGVSRCLTDWATTVGLKASTIRQRLAVGWTHKQAVCIPLCRNKATAATHRSGLV